MVRVIRADIAYEFLCPVLFFTYLARSVCVFFRGEHFQFSPTAKDKIKLQIYFPLNSKLIKLRIFAQTCAEVKSKR